MKLIALQVLLVALVGCARGGIAPYELDDGEIHESIYVPIGGIDQYITINGKDARKPVLLLVHGGPADVQSPFRDAYRAYERDFIFVQWDQRGAGKTFARSRENTPDLRLERIVADGIQLAQYLTGRLRQKRIWILGHSWGSVVATEMVQQRPDLFSGYIGTGQVGSWTRGVQYQHDFVLKAAAERGEESTVKGLKEISDFDPTNVQHFLAVSEARRGYLGDADKAWLSSIGELTSKSTSPQEAKDIGDGMNLSGRALFSDQIEVDLFKSAREFHVPVYIVQGTEDLFTPTQVAVEYFESILAPEKKMFQIDGAGHFALVTHQERFVELLSTITGTD